MNPRQWSDLKRIKEHSIDELMMMMPKIKREVRFDESPRTKSRTRDPKEVVKDGAGLLKKNTVRRK